MPGFFGKYFGGVGTLSGFSYFAWYFSGIYSPPPFAAPAKVVFQTQFLTITPGTNIRIFPLRPVTVSIDAGNGAAWYTFNAKPQAYNPAQRYRSPFVIAATNIVNVVFTDSTGITGTASVTLSLPLAFPRN